MFYFEKWSRKYLLRLAEEIDDIYNNEPIKSIYIGGGTPSCLAKEEIEQLFTIIKKFKITPECEITFECNLNDINEELLQILKKNNVNRLSIGIQSFNKDSLQLLKRCHNFEEAVSKMSLIRKYDFNNVNLDLIYAIPGQSIKDLKQDLKLFLKLKPEHISTYSLMIEPHTFLYVKGVQPISEDLDEEMYRIICHTLQKSGFNHYEISNFAKPNYESKHNLTYWNNEEYYGFGLSASGYVDKIRYTNTKNLTQYLSGSYHGTQEILTDKDIMDNEMMLGLRKIKGINKEEFEKKYHVKIEDNYPIKPLLKNGDLKQKKEYIFIPCDKLYIMNEILLKMI